MKTTIYPLTAHGPVFTPEQELLHVEEAVMGLRHVALHIASDRHMVHSDPMEFSNEFHVEHWGLIPVPRMCELTGVDPKIVQDVYAHYRADEELNPHIPPHITSSIFNARRQIITDLFPFNELNWWKEIPHPSPKKKGKRLIPLGRLKNRDVAYNDLDTILKRCQEGKNALAQAPQSPSRHLRAIGC